MKNLIIITFLSVISTSIPAYSQQGFKIDNTPDCPKSVTKGAQNTLNEYAYKDYQSYLDGVEEKTYEGEKVYKIGLNARITRKAYELIEFASIKYKCDLTNLQFPKLPINYR